MARVLVGNKWYTEITPSSHFLSETDLDRAIIYNLESIFPSFKAVSFKINVETGRAGEKSRKPDLALVNENYTEWYVIEVELASHDLDHVLSQVKTFKDGKYTDKHARHIHRKKHILDKDKLIHMVDTVQPIVMVIVDTLHCDWVDSLKMNNCLTCIFQVFLGRDGGNPIYRINGQHPYIQTGFCPIDLPLQTPNTVKLLEKGFLSSVMKQQTELEILFDGVISKWDNIDNEYLLCRDDAFPLDPTTSRYHLIFDKLSQFLTFIKV
jgi:hypothetical protein